MLGREGVREKEGKRLMFAKSIGICNPFRKYSMTRRSFTPDVLSDSAQEALIKSQHLFLKLKCSLSRNRARICVYYLQMLLWTLAAQTGMCRADKLRVTDGDRVGLN